MYTGVLPACIFVYHMYAVPAEARRCFPGTGTMGGCEPPCGFWAQNQGPL